MLYVQRVCYGGVMHSSMGPISKTYRVYSSVEGNLESGKLTKRTVALYCS
ncbi:hypothetical protein APHMUC_0532 [Anaplasma phagocytophilum str. ApMUC09]|nr:hypothetical protein APHMUC_0532 [Anaplasma phagocytophilum str. ApMUC09]